MKTCAIALMSAAIIGGTAMAAAAQDTAKIDAGKAAYTAQKCQTCHSIAGVGMKPPAGTALDTVGTKLTPADIKKWLTDTAAMEARLPKKPVMSMAGYLKTHKLTAADVDALVAYLSSLKGS